VKALSALRNLAGKNVVVLLGSLHFWGEIRTCAGMIRSKREERNEVPEGISNVHPAQEEEK